MLKDIGMTCQKVCTYGRVFASYYSPTYLWQPQFGSCNVERNKYLGNTSLRAGIQELKSKRLNLQNTP